MGNAIEKAHGEARKEAFKYFVEEYKVYGIRKSTLKILWSQFWEIKSLFPKSSNETLETRSITTHNQQTSVTHSLFTALESQEGIRLDDLELYVGVKGNPLLSHMIKFMDHDQSGVINFREFFLSIWAFCSIQENEYPALVFEIYSRLNRDGDWVINIDDMGNLVEDLLKSSQFVARSFGQMDNNSPHKNKDQLVQKMKRMDKTEKYFEKIPAIPYEKFMAFAESHRSLVWPAFMCMTTLSNKFGGQSLWRAERARQKAARKAGLPELPPVRITRKQAADRRADTFRRARANLALATPVAAARAAGKRRRRAAEAGVSPSGSAAAAADAKERPGRLEGQKAESSGGGEGLLAPGALGKTQCSRTPLKDRPTTSNDANNKQCGIQTSPKANNAPQIKADNEAKKGSAFYSMALVNIAAANKNFQRKLRAITHQYNHQTNTTNGSSDSSSPHTSSITQKKRFVRKKGKQTLYEIEKKVQVYNTFVRSNAVDAKQTPKAKKKVVLRPGDKDLCPSSNPCPNIASSPLVSRSINENMASQRIQQQQQPELDSKRVASNLTGQASLSRSAPSTPSGSSGVRWQHPMLLQQHGNLNKNRHHARKKQKDSMLNLADSAYDGFTDTSAGSTSDSVGLACSGRRQFFSVSSPTNAVGRLGFWVRQRGQHKHPKSKMNNRDKESCTGKYGFCDLGENPDTRRVEVKHQGCGHCCADKEHGNILCTQPQAEQEGEEKIDSMDKEDTNIILYTKKPQQVEQKGGEEDIDSVVMAAQYRRKSVQDRLKERTRAKSLNHRPLLSPRISPVHQKNGFPSSDFRSPLCRPHSAFCGGSKNTLKAADREAAQQVVSAQGQMDTEKGSQVEHSSSSKEKTTKKKKKKKKGARRDFSMKDFRNDWDHHHNEQVGLREHRRALASSPPTLKHAQRERLLRPERQQQQKDDVSNRSLSPRRRSLVVKTAPVSPSTAYHHLEGGGAAHCRPWVAPLGSPATPTTACTSGRRPFTPVRSTRTRGYSVSSTRPGRTQATTPIRQRQRSYTGGASMQWQEDQKQEVVKVGHIYNTRGASTPSNHIARPRTASAFSTFQEPLRTQEPNHPASSRMIAHSARPTSGSGVRCSALGLGISPRRAATNRGRAASMQGGPPKNDRDQRRMISSVSPQRRGYYN